MLRVPFKSLCPTGPSTAGERIIRFEMSLPDGVNYTALGLPSLAISPLGTHIAMAANNGIYLRAFDDPEAALDDQEAVTAVTEFQISDDFLFGIDLTLPEPLEIIEKKGAAG